MLKSLLTQREECFHIALLCVACDIPASRKVFRVNLISFLKIRKGKLIKIYGLIVNRSILEKTLYN